MGHVDHGKTSLLDYIRKSNIIAGESGASRSTSGLTTWSARAETLSSWTPRARSVHGHEGRGAKVTDIIVLVVAADDGVMPKPKRRSITVGRPTFRSWWRSTRSTNPRPMWRESAESWPSWGWRPRNGEDRPFSEAYRPRRARAWTNCSN